MSETDKVVSEQLETFHKQYDIERFLNTDERGKDWFIMELKYWVRKFKNAIDSKQPSLILKNPLIEFTESPAFLQEAQPETIVGLLPFLEQQLKLAEHQIVPKFRKTAILPLGNITVGEFKLQVAEKLPKNVVERVSEKEWLEIINGSQTEVAKMISEVKPSVYQMDTDTLKAQIKQQQKNNEENYVKLLKMREETLKTIENTPADVPHNEKVRLQQQSVSINERIAEFQQWFIGNKLPIPPSDVIIVSGLKGNLLDECKKVCERMSLPKGKTFTGEMKYKIAQEIDLNGLGKFKSFKSGNRAYHRISKMLSELGYSQKAASKYREE